MILINLIFIVLALIFAIFFSKKYKILSSITGNIHQKYSNSENVPLVGGLIIFLSLILKLDLDFLSIYFFAFLFLLLGIFSDLNKISSPMKRLVIQSVLIIIFVGFNSLSINQIKINLIDVLLNNFYFNIFFTSLCILIIINGTNFMDGMNNLVLGYFLAILLLLKYLGKNGYELPEFFDLNLFIYSLTILYVFNFFNKVYIGDNGAYIIGLIFSFILINFYNLNDEKISAFFIVLILWYPAFENLFSILRKIRFRKSPIRPDTSHLHQLIFIFLKKKLTLKNKFINTLTGNLINFFNLLIFFFGMQKIYSNNFQILIIFISIIIYFFIYVRLTYYKK